MCPPTCSECFGTGCGMMDKYSCGVRSGADASLPAGSTSTALVASGVLFRKTRWALSPMKPILDPGAAMKTHWYKLSAADVLKQLGSDAATGLSSAEAQARLAKVGPNELVETRRPDAAGDHRRAAHRRVDDPPVRRRAGLGGARRLDRGRGDPGHRGAQRRPGLHRRSTRPSSRWPRSSAWPCPRCACGATARCRRSPPRDLVPGDVVLLETGNLVPADGRVLESVNLRVEEAALTGESEPVEKDPALVFETETAAGRPPQHGLQRHHRHLRPRRGRGDRDRHADRAGPHRRR